MISGIGIDLIEIDRIKGELEKSGDRFCTSIFTENEIKYCKAGSNIDVQAQRFAGRFSAKEAFFKAIGRRINWTDVELYNLSSGKPQLKIRNKKGLGIEKSHVSISHLKDFAVAAVILEGKK